MNYQEFKKEYIRLLNTANDVSHIINTCIEDKPELCSEETISKYGTGIKSDIEKYTSYLVSIKEEVNEITDYFAGSAEVITPVSVSEDASQFLKDLNSLYNVERDIYNCVHLVYTSIVGEGEDALSAAPFDAGTFCQSILTLMDDIVYLLDKINDYLTSDNCNCTERSK